ncbi:SNF2 family N-terminal domain-containing protein [Suillus fuscotomentosus]|uniref:SNF2 family N-terminal domain-containing protein n=1 Tax=Suillus fuscotomentosus TaxID=1912939 RepID=A0AAD4EL91_9AGAM|nr:SNF2 family N-terminal domain-containing protein [Suillus fuscotomentosus]KAG1908274.1 SNF2 family N-terminal domain-containing protein [Suillus fuscotomentosus]
MATHAPSGSSPNIQTLSLDSYSQSNHIDLTLDDDEPNSSESVFNSGSLKRPTTDYHSPPPRPSMFYDPVHSAEHQQSYAKYSLPNQLPLAYHSPPMKPSIFSPLDQTSFNSSPPPLHLQSSSYRPVFVGPSQAPRNTSTQLPITGSARTLPPLVPSRPSSSVPPSNHQVIDLTDSPSPPPSPRPRQQPMSSALPDDLHPKTPVCIGQLTVTALVLYPVSYLQGQDLPNEIEWANVRLQYEHNPQRAGATETIHIKTPSSKTLSGEPSQGEAFGVVEQKVATDLGPMLGKGLIRLDAKVRRGSPNLPILPLQMLVYTPKGNIAVVGSYLQSCGLMLDHPSGPYDISRLMNYHYCNPHAPPPGGHRSMLPSRSGYAGPGGNSPRWNAPMVSGKTLEVQRSQIDELFKSLKSGDELAETEPTNDIGTTLYPHQKKAVTFLLEREREKRCADGRYSSLWQPRNDLHTGQSSWFHIVTQKEVFQEPQEAKGAILADDMGLGKTITCVSLIAATLDSAHAFAATPLPPPPAPPPERSMLEDPLTAAHFAGSVWGIPEVDSPSFSVKGKGKAAKAQDKAEAEYARACRIKAKSRATLIICPLSTVSNWEDQFREHWRGEVTVVGGGGMSCSAATLSSLQNNSPPSSQAETKVETKPPRRKREGRPLRVYVYHGNSRRPDAGFLADFDAVITTYATLASEYSKQNRKMANVEAEDDDDGSSDGYGGVDVDERGNQVLKLPKQKRAGMKRKKSCSSFGASEASSALQTIHWFRVVLDEAHSIKETQTVGSRASCDLMADRRLCLTGTPVQNKLDDVYALIKFLRLEPFDDKNIWTEFIGTPVKYGQSLGVARLQTIMKCITLRRTKESKASDGRRILHLPPRRDELRYLKFDPHEQTIYDQFFLESKAEFNELSNKNEVMKNYVGILQKILRLRQICDHFELVEGKGPLGDMQNMDLTSYEDIAAAIGKEGLNPSRAAAIVALLREAATTQCVECGEELCMSSDQQGQMDVGVMDMDGPSAPKRGRKTKGSGSRAPTRASSPSAPSLVLTRCQHLFCLGCYRQCVCPGWPDVPTDIRRSCSACQTGLLPQDAVRVRPDCSPVDFSVKKKPAKREKRTKGVALENFHPSTKVKALLGDLMQFSRANPHSVNYDPDSIEVEMVDNEGNKLDDGVIKTVVFSQWTTMLDKIEDALETAGIRYDRLDGTMKRDDRTRAMEALKHDPGCEVLLVSLKAGGVGLNLTAAQRVYLMDPYWNPAVENQAVDRIHRLGQTRPVTTVKLIIENSIEDRLLEVQRKKTELANMTLGQNFSKADMLQRRMEELNQLFAA